MKKGNNFKKNNEKKYRVNGRIRAREVRVIDPEGSQLGVLPIRDALTRATELGLDLVEMAPNARPPVCRITDFGKMRYDASKKQKTLKKKSNQQIIKTVKMKPNIGENDLNRKIADVQKFINKGYRVVVQLSVKGRQRKFMQLAQDQTIFKVQEGLVAAIMEKPQSQGSQVTVTFIKDAAAAAKLEKTAKNAANGDETEETINQE
jgi:translation initiation factor IF-3